MRKTLRSCVSYLNAAYLSSSFCSDGLHDRQGEFLGIRPIFKEIQFIAVAFAVKTMVAGHEHEQGEIMYVIHVVKPRIALIDGAYASVAQNVGYIRPRQAMHAQADGLRIEMGDHLAIEADLREERFLIHGVAVCLYIVFFGSVKRN